MLLPAEIRNKYKIFDTKELLDEFWLTDKACARGVMVGGQGSAHIVIDLDDDAVFDPKQGCFIVSWLHALDRNLAPVITGFWYDGKIYKIEEGEVESVMEKSWVWSAPEDKTVYLIKTPTKEMEEVLSTDWEKLPVLIFRTRTIAKKIEKFWRAVEVEVMPWSEKEGVAIVTDYDAGGRPYVEVDTLWRGLEESLGSKELNNPDWDSGYKVMREMSIDVADETLLYFKGKLHKEQRMWNTVAAVWPKSMDGCYFRPQANKMLIRQLDYIGMDSDSQQPGTEEEKFGNTFADYLLVDGKICRIPPTYVDVVLVAVAAIDGTGVKVEDERGARLVPESYLDLVKLGSEEEVPELEVTAAASSDDDDEDEEWEDDDDYDEGDEEEDAEESED